METDLAALTGQPKTIRSGGKEWTFYPLRISHFGALQAWLNDQFPNPVRAAYDMTEGLPLAVRQHAVAAAVEVAARPKPKLGSAEATGILMSLDGIRQFLGMSLAKGEQPKPEHVAAIDELLDVADEATLAEAIRATGVHSLLSDPKAR
jgi:hypothetical protein